MQAPELERRTESAKGFNRPEAAAALRRGRFASCKQTLARVIKSRKKVVRGVLVALGVRLSWWPPPPGSVTSVVFLGIANLCLAPQAFIRDYLRWVLGRGGGLRRVYKRGGRLH